MFPLVVAVLTMLVFLDLLPPGQERWRWLVLVHIHVSVTYLDINNGVNLTIPQTSDYHISPRYFVLVTTLTYILLGSGTTLMY